MDENLMRSIRKAMTKKSTEKLRQLYSEHKESHWSPEAFEVIRQVLTERGEVVVPYAPKEARPKQPEREDKVGLVISACVFGPLIGGIIGYLLAPSIPLIGGRLPLYYAITRGATLSGDDQILLPFAIESFNYMLVGAIAGVAIGLALVYGKFRIPGIMVQEKQPSIPEEIKQLSQLRDTGALTEEEFQSKKQELLKRL